MERSSCMVDLSMDLIGVRSVAPEQCRIELSNVALEVVSIQAISCKKFFDLGWKVGKVVLDFNVSRSTADVDHADIIANFVFKN
uniref:Uncharacterized protein n=1 Tax=Caenorhabditis japonica TaxID=281687 RepID=A0A8R1EK38_CAEJA